MPDMESEIHQLLRTQWPGPPSEKARRYIGKFYACERIANRITGKVEGNHGTYTVSIWIDEERVSSTCGCYIGKHGYCHHCAALAYTFLQSPATFQEVISKGKNDLSSPGDLPDYLKSTTLDTLLAELKAKGIPRKRLSRVLA